MRKRRLALAAAVVMLAGGGAAWMIVADRADEPEVCETTVYEGCPERWDYLTEE